MRYLIIIIFFLLCFNNPSFANCIQGNCEDGIGTFESPKGFKYQGGFKNKNPHGYGSFYYSNGSKYVGEFVNGKREGKGEYNFSSGYKYVGDFKDGKFHGKGAFSSADGNKYVGDFKDGKFHGKGAFSWADGTKYTGDYVNGKREGKGVYVNSDGRALVGDFKNNEFLGYNVEKKKFLKEKKVVSRESDFKTYPNNLKLEEIIKVVNLCKIPSSLGQSCKVKGFDLIKFFNEMSVTLDRDKITYYDGEWHYIFKIIDKKPNEMIVEFVDDAVIGTYLSTDLIKLKYVKDKKIWKLHSRKGMYPEEDSTFKIITGSKN